MTFCTVLFTGFDDWPQQSNYPGYQHAISQDGHHFAGEIDSHYEEQKYPGSGPAEFADHRY